MQVLAALGLMDSYQERGDRWAAKALEWLEIMGETSTHRG